MTRVEKYSNGYFLIDPINENQVFIGESAKDAFSFVNRLLWDPLKIAEKERRERIEAKNASDKELSK